MKKTLIITLASIALVGCSQDETVATMDRVAIEFDKVFVENSTSSRATDLTTANLENFAVYGSVEKGGQEGNIFNKQEVTGTQAGGYTYSPAQYWIPGANYHFIAIAPFEDAHWTYTWSEENNTQYGNKQVQNGTITFNNESAAASQDLLWAYQPASTANVINQAPGAVSFSFQHLLSRVKFTFKNGFATGSNIQLKVKDVQITNAHSQGTLAITNGTVGDTWTASNTADEDKFTRIFGDANGEPVADYYAPQTSASTAHYYLMPVKDASYTIKFTIDLYQAGVLLLEDIQKETKILTPTLMRGFSYEFKAELNASNTTNDGALEPIEFQVSGVKGWEDYTGNDATVTIPAK